MDERDFCFWLSGFAENCLARPSVEEWRRITEKLAEAMMPKIAPAEWLSDDYRRTSDPTFHRPDTPQAA